MVCAPLAGILADRIGERPLLVSGMLLQATGAVWLALTVTAQLPYDRMLLPLVVGGCGISMAMPGAQKAAVTAVRPEEIGQASGVFNTLRQLGAVFGIAVCAVAFTRGGGTYASPAAFTDGFRPALWVTAGLALVGATAALAVRRTGVTGAEPSAVPAAGDTAQRSAVGRGTATRVDERT